MTALVARLIGRSTVAECRRQRFHPSKSAARTTHEYGRSAAQQALKIRFQESPEAQLRRAELRFGRVSNTGQLRLTMRGAEAYIPVLGAPSAYGAIARL
jgi:hypothetical protein